VEKTLDLLRELATKLGQTVDYLWPEYLRFIVWNATAEMFAFGLVLILALVLYRVLSKRCPSWTLEDHWHNIKPTWKPFGLAVVVLVALAFIVNVCTNVPRIASPAGSVVDRTLRGAK